MRLILLAIVFGMLVGCGNSGGSTYVTETEPIEVPGSTDIVMTAGGDGELNYAYADDGSIVIGSDNGEINVVQGDGYIENTTIIEPTPDVNESSSSSEESTPAPEPADTNTT